MFFYVYFSRLMHLDRLCCESLFYYRVILDYISKLGEASTDLIDRILPEAKGFIDYVSK